MTVYGSDELYREIAFMGYYFHWGQEEITGLPHLVRRRYCREINRINRKAEGGKNLFEC